jgi:hypothetical protein
MSVPEMCLARRAAFHGLVMGVLVRIIEDFHGGWLQRFVDLQTKPPSQSNDL